MGSTQRGAIVTKNDNGSLECVDGTRTYIGTATMPDGKVITQRFRRSEPDDTKVIERWLKWQSKAISKKEDILEEKKSSKNAKFCPLTNLECNEHMCQMWSVGQKACAFYLCGIGLNYISTNFLKTDFSEELELIAMAVNDLKTAPVKAPLPAKDEKNDGFEQFLQGKPFFYFVNLHSKSVHQKYKAFCASNGYSPIGEAKMIEKILENYQELEGVKTGGGQLFMARGEGLD